MKRLLLALLAICPACFDTAEHLDGFEPCSASEPVAIVHELAECNADVELANDDVATVAAEMDAKDARIAELEAEMDELLDRIAVKNWIIGDKACNNCETMIVEVELMDDLQIVELEAGE